MTTVAYAVVLATLAVIGVLPRVFFQRGRLNLRWWLTAAPFVACGALVAAAWTGVIPPPPATLLRSSLAVAAATASLALIAGSMRSHRRRPALWHQDDDEPSEIVQRGPYRYVRHPLYTAYLATLLAAVLAVPHPLVIATAVYGAVMLHVTSRREERRLLRSSFGADYAAYMRRAGRFLPRIGRLA